MKYNKNKSKVITNSKLSAPNKVDVSGFINKKQLYRYKQDIKDYKDALQAAESLYSPNRERLYNIYTQVIDDAHLASVMQSRKIKSLAHPFKVTRDGKDDEVATALFANKQWFQEYLSLSFESLLWGYSLMKLVADGTEITGVELVPRIHVKPVQHLVVANPGDVSGIDYTSAPYSSWYIGVGKESDLGLLSKVAPLVLLKNHTVGNWAQFCSLFGIPLRIGQTNLGSPDQTAAMYKTLDEMSSAAFAVIDNNDKITMGAAVAGDGKVFESFLRYSDEQISKVMLGGTMNSDNGSSRSQSEVHERLADTYSEYDLRNLAFAVNDSLFPLLISKGYDLTNCTFQFYEPEDTTALFNMTVQLINAGYAVEPTFIETKFNIPTIKVVTPAPTDKGNFQKPE